MVKGCNVTETFGVGHTKKSYYVGHGLGPIVRDELIKDINISGNMFTILLDETTTTKFVTQMDFLERYCCEAETEIVTRYLDPKFFGHSKTDDLCVKVIDVFESNFDSQLFFDLSMNSPNVNKSLWEKVFPGFNSLLLLVMCNLHVAHKAFQHDCTH